MASLARLVGNGLYSAGAAAANGLARLTGYGATEATPAAPSGSGRSFRPIAARPSTPTADLPGAERDRREALDEIRKPALQRSGSVPADALQNTATRVDAAATQTLEEARVRLRRLADNPTELRKEVHFTVNFGGKQIKVPYRIRHNGFVTPTKHKVLKAQAEQTRLALQALYNHFDDDDNLGAVKKNKKLSILKDIQHYEVVPHETSSGEVHLKVVVVDSKGRTIKHTFKENITVNDAGAEKVVDLEAYVNNMTESVHTAAKQDEEFSKKCGFDFFQRMILAGGVTEHALYGPNPKLGQKMPGHIPQPPLGNPQADSNLSSQVDLDRRAHYQQYLRDQQNQRLAAELQQSREGLGALGQPPAGAFRPI